MQSTFRLIKPAPLTERVKSRDSSIYLFRGMWVIGWLAPKEGIWRYVYLIWSFTTFSFGVFYLPAAFLISYVREFSNFSPSEFFTSLQVAINAYGSSVKCIITYSFMWRLRKTQNLLDRLDERLLKDDDRQKIHNAVARCNYAFLIFTFIYCGFAGSTFFSMVLNGSPPWSIYNPFVDWRDSTANLWIQSIFEYIVMSFAVLQCQLSDTYPLVFTLIIRAHFEVLKDHVRNLRMDPDKTEQENYDELTNCIMDYKIILRCCNMIRPMIYRTIFVQFLLIGSVLGLTLFNIFFYANFWQAVGSAFFVITILLQTFPFCYICNMLSDDSEDLANMIFHSNWVDSEPRYKTTLINFMQHVQQPIVFIAGGIFVVSMNSNISVAKFAFSIITIAKQMNLAEQFQ
ncbi:odorant receptor 59b [Drosophila grimshawi]|uniref:Odorant receptor n=1 Tax=Drosophila grimshawi TaxID=7222 RepID=B4J7E6_DROGR|nr:odorant receptor 59b [Drosophila grimshawi]EDW01070.1 GH20654 [Drosophila grimshawi]